MSYSHIFFETIPKTKTIRKWLFKQPLFRLARMSDTVVYLNTPTSCVWSLQRPTVSPNSTFLLSHWTKTAYVLFKPAFAEEEEEEIAENAPLGTRWHTFPYSASGKTVEAAWDVFALSFHSQQWKWEWLHDSIRPVAAVSHAVTAVRRSLWPREW